MREIGGKTRWAEKTMSYSDEWTWVWRGGITGLVAIVFWWIKRWVNGIDAWIKAREKAETENGGLVDREKHFLWCTQRQNGCPVREHVLQMTAWRTDLLNRGGVVSLAEHHEICAENTNHVLHRMTEMFEHHRELVKEQLANVGLASEKKILEAISQLKLEVKHGNGLK